MFKKIANFNGLLKIIYLYSEYYFSVCMYVCMYCSKVFMFNKSILRGRRYSLKIMWIFKRIATSALASSTFSSKYKCMYICNVIECVFFKQMHFEDYFGDRIKLKWQ